MNLKGREPTEFSHLFKEFLLRVVRLLKSRKSKILFGIIKIIVILFVGIFLGLLITKFFGTFDNPSRAALNFVNLGGLRDEKYVMDGIKGENIKLPFNWIKGQFSNPEKIFIDINFENYQKLEFKRQQALELQTLLTSSEDYVPATITHGNIQYDVRLRLKGDHVDHLETDKWSFRIKVKDDKSIFGMKVFSIQHPKTRIYSNELLYNLMLKEEGVLAPRYSFIEVVINGENKGIYALEEHFSKELAESNERREGMFLKFSENFIWEEYAKRNSLEFDFEKVFQAGIIETFDNDEFLEDPVKKEQFVKAQNLLESFRREELKTHEVFDSKKLASYFAVTTLINADHGAGPQNIRFYYNPITSLLEPIGFDGYVNPSNSQVTIMNYIPSCLDLEAAEQTCTPKKDTFLETIFSDEVFFREYVKELEKISEEDYLDSLFEKINPELDRAITILYKDYPYANVPKEGIYRNQIRIKQMLNPIKGINVYFQEEESSNNTVVLSVGNINPFPVDVLNLKINDSHIPLNHRVILQPYQENVEVEYRNIEVQLPSKLSEVELNNAQIEYQILGAGDIKASDIVPWSNFDKDFKEKDFIRKQPNISELDMFYINETRGSILIKQGNWRLEESITIPKGYIVFAREGISIDLVNGAMILSYSEINFQGTINNPIEIFSSDSTGQGLSVFNSGKSFLNYVNFRDLTYPSKEGWSLTGSVNFYESPIDMKNVLFYNINSEDSVNFIHSEFNVEEVTFKNCSSDCIDNDFSKGSIKNSLFEDCGGDCIDISGAIVNITNVRINEVGDKGISVGENSTVNVFSCEINNGFIGIGSKDKSKTFIQEINLSNLNYGLAIYEKKSEYGPAIMISESTMFNSVDKNYILDRGSSLTLDGTIILGKEENLYETLYGGTT